MVVRGRLDEGHSCMELFARCANELANLARSASQFAAHAVTRHLQIGNLISPLTLFGDATQPLEDLATQLKQQMSRAMRQRDTSRSAVTFSARRISSVGSISPHRGESGADRFCHQPFRVVRTGANDSRRCVSHVRWRFANRRSADLHAGLFAHGRCARSSCLARARANFLDSSFEGTDDERRKCPCWI